MNLDQDTELFTKYLIDASKLIMIITLAGSPQDCTAQPPNQDLQ